MRKVRQHVQIVPPPQVFVAPNTNAGIPYIVQFSEPFFPKRMPAHLMPDHFHTELPNLTAGVEGVAWMKPWEPPFFPLRMKVELQQTQMWDPRPPVEFSLIQGMAWWYPFDQPKQKRTDVNAHQTHSRAPTPPSQIASIQGIAWMRPWEPPYFPRKYSPNLIQTSVFISTFRIVGISGIAWYRDWVPPLHPIQVNYVNQQTSMWSSRAAPSVFSRGYIIGPA